MCVESVEIVEDVEIIEWESVRIVGKRYKYPGFTKKYTNIAPEFNRLISAQHSESQRDISKLNEFFLFYIGVDGVRGVIVSLE
jgi:hypothetical protein